MTPSRRAPWADRPGFLLGATLLAALAAAGCRINKLVADSMGGSLEDTTRAFNAEAAPRHAREAAPGLLKLLDGFILSSPENEELLLRAAQMNSEFAFAFIELEDTSWARILYGKALDYALRALAEENDDLRAALDAPGDELARAIGEGGELDEDSIPALFWCAFAWGGYINMSRDQIGVVGNLPKVASIMTRLTEVAPTFYYGGPHLFLAVYYASRGKLLGGDPRKSKLHFERVFAITERRFLLAHVLYAKYGCVALGEEDPAFARAEFTRILDEVLAAPEDILPEQRLGNAIAKQRARALKAELDDLILPPLPPDDQGDSR